MELKVPETIQLHNVQSLKGKILREENYREVRTEWSGPRFCVPSRNTGQGVYFCGELKEINSVSIGKPTSPQLVRVRGAV